MKSALKVPEGLRLVWGQTVDTGKCCLVRLEAEIVLEYRQKDKHSYVPDAHTHMYMSSHMHTHSYRYLELAQMTRSALHRCSRSHFVPTDVASYNA